MLVQTKELKYLKSIGVTNFGRMEVGFSAAYVSDRDHFRLVRVSKPGIIPQ